MTEQAVVLRDDDQAPVYARRVQGPSRPRCCGPGLGLIRLIDLRGNETEVVCRVLLTEDDLAG